MLQETNDRAKMMPHINLEKVENLWERTGFTLKDLDKLSIIHVSGTKGKVIK